MISKNGIITVVKNSRWYSSDMTVFSCLVCFLYSISINGNVVNGIIAFVGILFAHMATNLYDDYDDYKKLCEDARFSEFTPSVKCAYLKKGAASTKDLLCVIILYCAIASSCGAFLLLKSGWTVLVLAIIGAAIVLSYPKLSRKGLSEFAVGIAFGPLLFEGMYFVMTESFSFEVFLLSLAVVMFTIGVMYNHTLLDYESDKFAGKMTIVQRLGNRDLALKGVWGIYSLGYFFILVFSLLTENYLCILSFLTIPFVFLLYKSLKEYSISTYYERDERYLQILKASAKLMALFSFLISVGLFFSLFRIL